jgi:dUTP pyrophosphatase
MDTSEANFRERLLVDYTPNPISGYTPGPLRVQKLDPRAELPYKERQTDVGHDIVLIDRTDNRSEDDCHAVNMFRTGIIVAPPAGYHVELVARSSLQTQGYILANSIGIIDPEYRGELLVALYKFNECNDLELPCRAVQIVTRKTEYSRICEVKNAETSTSRGDLGFGSSGGYSTSKKTEKTQPQSSSARKKQTSHFS